MNLRAGILILFILLAYPREFAAKADPSVRGAVQGILAVRQTGNLQEGCWTGDPSDERIFDVKETHNTFSGLHSQAIQFNMDTNSDPHRIIRLDPLFLDRPPPGRTFFS
jgi:hypothetical protein